MFFNFWVSSYFCSVVCFVFFYFRFWGVVVLFVVLLWILFSLWVCWVAGSFVLCVCSAYTCFAAWFGRFVYGGPWVGGFTFVFLGLVGGLCLVSLCLLVFGLCSWFGRFGFLSGSLCWFPAFLFWWSWLGAGLCWCYWCGGFLFFIWGWV